jgi:hypothetical protein
MTSKGLAPFQQETAPPCVRTVLCARGGKHIDEIKDKLANVHGHIVFPLYKVKLLKSHSQTYNSIARSRMRSYFSYDVIERPDTVTMLMAPCGVSGKGKRGGFERAYLFLRDISGIEFEEVQSGDYGEAIVEEDENTELVDYLGKHRKAISYEATLQSSHRRGKWMGRWELEKHNYAGRVDFERPERRVESAGFQSSACAGNVIAQ